MSAAALSLPLQVSTDWYRQPSVKVAFVLSLLVHAGVILLLPGLRVPVPSESPPMIVELAPVPAPVVAPAPPVPEPKPAAAPRPPPPPVKEKPPEPPPVITRVAPQPEAPPELRVPPQPEPKPEPRPQPVPEPRVEAPPPVAQPRLEPPPAVVEPPAKTAAPAPPPPSVPDPGLRDAYGKALHQAIAQRKSYPRLALLRRLQGTTQLRLQFGTDGKLSGLTIARSSGFDVLDQQAVTMVKETRPLPEMPEALRGLELAIIVPVEFKLQ